MFIFIIYNKFNQYTVNLCLIANLTYTYSYTTKFTITQQITHTHTHASKYTKYTKYNYNIYNILGKMNLVFSIVKLIT